MKLISKIIKYNLDSSSKMQFALFYLKIFKFFFGKLSIKSKNVEMPHAARGSRKQQGTPRGSISLRHYDEMLTKIDM